MESSRKNKKSSLEKF